MTKPTHTPGPWTACRTLLDRKVIGFHITALPHGSAKPVCDVRDNWSSADHATLEANARLIAAAPELLAALKALADAVDTEVRMPPNSQQKNSIMTMRETAMLFARAVIAKAESGQK